MKGRSVILGNEGGKETRLVAQAVENFFVPGWADMTQAHAGDMKKFQEEKKKKKKRKEASSSCMYLSTHQVITACMRVILL